MSSTVCSLSSSRVSSLRQNVNSSNTNVPALAKFNRMAYRRNSRAFPLTVAGTPFAGVPSPELDRAWHDLPECSQPPFQSYLDYWYCVGTVIKVSKEDLDYNNVTSLPLANGSGYASEIFMTHEIHCLVGQSGQTGFEYSVIHSIIEEV